MRIGRRAYERIFDQCASIADMDWYPEQQGLSEQILIAGSRKLGGLVMKNTPLSAKENNPDTLKQTLINLKHAFCDVLEHCDYEQQFNDKYPFDRCFRELTQDVIEWVDSEINKL